MKMHSDEDEDDETKEGIFLTQTKSEASLQDNVRQRGEQIQETEIGFATEDEHYVADVENLVLAEETSRVHSQVTETVSKEADDGKLDSKGNIEGEDDDRSIKTSLFYNYVPQGFQLKSFYMHSKKLTDLVDVTYNPRTREFIFLDTRGITTWNKDSVHNKVTRGLNYPKYQNKLLVKIIYARKFNVYFCIAKDFSLKVLNMNFEETCNVDSDLSSVMFLIFNPVRDELITGGVKGTMVWEFRQDTDRVWTEIKPMANYALFFQRELKCVGGSWVKKIELDQHQQYLYCCSDTDVICYDIHGRLVFKLVDAHQSQITGCKYSPQAKLLVTCSADTNVKVWSMTGGHVHTFRGHSRAVTNILLHPESPSVVLTSSMDGSVRLWSLEIMEMLYSIVVSTEGIQWIGLTGENYLWTATKRDVSVWHLNYVEELYTLARSKITSIKVLHCVGKTSRVVAVGDDSSIRLVSIKHRKNLSTVLPPPNISPLEKLLGMAYNREYSLAYLLVTPLEIWVYTMRTDPACRIAIWDVCRVQDKIQRCQSVSTATTPLPGQERSASPLTARWRQNQESSPTTSRAECTSLTILNKPIMYKGEEGYVCPVKTNFLVLGMQDGRILFMDPIKFALNYYEFKAYKDAILEINVDEAHCLLTTKCKSRTGAMFRFWDLPSLTLKYEVNTDEDTIAYALLDDVFLTGHVTGHIALYKLLELHQPTTKLYYGRMETVAHPHQNELVQSKVEHIGAVVAIDSCPELQIFVSCGEDNVVKTWDKNKTVLTEVILNEPISAAHFLNVKGDLLIGYKNHLFTIHHTKLLSQDLNSASIGSFVESESDIYEDPAVRFEGVSANPDPLNMERYLVPYNLDFSNKFLEGESSESEKASDEEYEEDSDSDMSLAPTEVYISPNGTPRCLSFVDMILNSDLNEHDIKTRWVKLKMEKSNLRKKEVDDIKSGLEDIEMPKFGTSPGPSPTVTPPSTPEFSSSSEDEDETGDLQEDESLSPVDTQSLALDFKSLIEVQQPEPLPVKKTPEEKPALEEVSRFSLSRYKIDANSLMKDSKDFKQPVAKETASSQQKNKTVAKKEEIIEKPSSASRRVIQKKKQKVNKVLVKERVQSSTKQRTPSNAEVEMSRLEPDNASSEDLPMKEEIEVTEGIDEVKDVPTEESYTETKKVRSIQFSDQALQPSDSQLTSAPELVPSEKSLPRSHSSNSKSSEVSGGKKSSMFSSWKKKKPTSAVSGTDLSEDSESDDSTNITIPDGSLIVGVTPRSPKEKLRHGATSKHGEKSKHEEKSKHREKIKHGEKSKNEKKAPKSSATGSISFLKAASRLSITEKYSLHKASKRSVGRGTPEGRPASVASTSDGSIQRTASPCISSRVTSAGGLATPSLEDSNQADEEHGTGEARSSSTNGMHFSKPRPKQTLMGKGLKSLMRLQHNRDTDEYVDIEEGMASAKAASERLTHPLFSDVYIPLKPTIKDGTQARPNTAEHSTSRRHSLERPHTVATGDVHATYSNDEYFDADFIQRYLSCPGSPVDMFRLLRNDGTKFEDNWQGRMIERNHILKLKKEQRARFALERRRSLELRQRQRRQALMGHHHCSNDTSGHQTLLHCMTRSDSSLDLLKKDQSQRASTLKSPAPPGTPPPPQPKHYKEVNDLSKEQAYRFRLAKDPKTHQFKTTEMFERAEGISSPMLLKRPPTGKSIPSKAKFVLIKPFNTTPMRLTPSPLEEQLLVERFPMMSERIRQDALKRNAPTPSLLVSNVPYN
ncbi:uncharacterized protein LOC117114300 isoform X2 [Anneissia japonica]|uniref:uncharacterized protein LOC117114300 isoform X2 n=1 Tax=Anneissia japonica TaxID=1529436 RepID=UPI0014258385|nr:uncharacterized protein LOC117114300 isoform X2 [Anneissia japonica]